MLARMIAILLSSVFGHTLDAAQTCLTTADLGWNRAMSSDAFAQCRNIHSAKKYVKCVRIVWVVGKLNGSSEVIDEIPAFSRPPSSSAIEEMQST